VGIKIAKIIDENIKIISKVGVIAELIIYSCGNMEYK